MATKNNPGAFDCYANAAPDEPIFVLRANDVLASHLVRIWAVLRRGQSFPVIMEDVELAQIAVLQKPKMDPKKYHEARQCASDMEKWKQTHGK